MKVFYSRSTNGFYEAVDNTLIPVDAVEITDECRSQLLAAQANGSIITAAEDGTPISVDRPAPTTEQLNGIVVHTRKAEYIDKSDPLFFLWQLDLATKQDWISARDAVKAAHPKV